MEPIGVGLRAVALIIDAVIIILVATVLTFVMGYGTGAQLIISLLAFAYVIVLEALKGATVGKMVMGLRVVKLADGSAISWKESVIRNILRIVDGLFFYLVGAIIIWVSKNKQRLGDIAAATIVVKKSA